MKGKLFLIPTVIADDTSQAIPQQVKDVLSSIKTFLVENVRTSRRYISSLRLDLTIEELQFDVLDKKTSKQRLDELLRPLLDGENMGILSESGCPGIADPGAIAVNWAHKKNIDVIPLVGPSSIFLALMASGFNGQKFCFNGYLPIDKKELEKEIRKLEQESRRSNQTQIFIETPYRNNQLFKTLTQVSDSRTMLCISKDVTGKTEMIKTKTMEQWKKESIDLHKIPTVFLLYAGR